MYSLGSALKYPLKIKIEKMKHKQMDATVATETAASDTSNTCNEAI